jgi:hypothetical protein
MDVGRLSRKRSVPVRSLTFYTGHTIDALAPKGFSTLAQSLPANDLDCGRVKLLQLTSGLSRPGADGERMKGRGQKPS